MPAVGCARRARGGALRYHGSAASHAWGEREKPLIVGGNLAKGVLSMAFTALVLAAGEGTRMKSAYSKTVHPLLGKPLVAWPIEAARAAGAERIVCVVGAGKGEVAAICEGLGAEVVEQTERLGTGHAVRVALEATGIDDGCVVVLYGDTPLVRAETIDELASEVAERGLPGAVLTMKPEDPTGYGRIVLDDAGHILAIIEHADATLEQREALTECNSGVYAFDGATLARLVSEIKNDNAQGEYYLTDMVELMRSEGLAVGRVFVEDPNEMLGVNSRAQLAEATKAMQLRINAQLMAAGVTMLDPNLVWVGPDVKVGQDTELWPLTFLFGETTIGKGDVVGPNTRLTDVTVGDDCRLEETVAIESVIEDGVTCGPRAYLRPGTHLMPGAHVGTSVEIKNSTIGEGSKVPHLSYIGDTTMGSGVNIGAASVTCNYDGSKKHRTTIGNDVFIGSDTMMVAPVSIGDGAITGAASCITKDVPAGALGIERSEQRIIEGYTEKRAARKAEGDER